MGQARTALRTVRKEVKARENSYCPNRFQEVFEIKEETTMSKRIASIMSLFVIVGLLAACAPSPTPQIVKS